MNATGSAGTDSSSRPKTMKIVLLAAVIAIALGVAGYLTASMQAGSRQAAQEAAHAQAMLAVQADLESARQALAEARERNHLLAASAALYRTSADLDDRNFGTADMHLKQAAAAVARAAEAAGGADPEVSEISAELGQMDINVATDLAVQRSRVLALAAQVDALAQRD